MPESETFYAQRKLLYRGSQSAKVTYRPWYIYVRRSYVGAIRPPKDGRIRLRKSTPCFGNPHKADEFPLKYPNGTTFSGRNRRFCRDPASSRVFVTFAGDRRPPISRTIFKRQTPRSLGQLVVTTNIYNSFYIRESSWSRSSLYLIRRFPGSCFFFVCVWLGRFGI